VEQLDFVEIKFAKNYLGVEIAAMMAGLFLLFFIAMVLAWTRQRTWAFAVLLISIALSTYWFYHHSGAKLTIIL